MRRAGPIAVVLLLFAAAVLLIHRPSMDASVDLVDAGIPSEPTSSTSDPSSSPMSPSPSSTVTSSNSPSDSGSPSESPSASTSPTTSPSTTPSSSPTFGSCDNDSVARGLLSDAGFDSDDYVVGARRVNWDNLPVQHVDRAFNEHPLRTKQAVVQFLQGDGPRSAAARGLIGDDAVVSGGDWVAVQFKNPVLYSGNYYWNGQPVKGGEQELILGGDIWWFNVTTTCTVELSDSVRAVCGNVGLDVIEPYTKD